jgi:N-acetylglucosaminyl-diphospho-decaprenol L-rhamnosyltransferase
MTDTDVVVVSYNSRDRLRACVEALAGTPDVQVFVVDNASTDDSLDAVRDLPLTAIDSPTNGGFAHGCNTGIAAGSSPYVLLLNPDTSLSPDALAALVAVLDAQSDVGAVAPRLVGDDGKLHFSLRRFARLRSTWARAFFVHRLAPRLDELVRERHAYEQAWSPEWVSGACVLLRRAALDEVGGLDEGFFLYREDMDLCRRLRDAGWDIRYEPGAVCAHVGGASAPRASLFPVLAASRIRYARKHARRAAQALERAGVAAEALTHAVAGRGRDARRGHARALLLVASRLPKTE